MRATIPRTLHPAPLPYLNGRTCACFERGARPATSAWCPLVTVGAIPGLRAGHQVGALDSNPLLSPLERTHVAEWVPLATKRPRVRFPGGAARVWATVRA